MNDLFKKRNELARKLAGMTPDEVLKMRTGYAGKSQQWQYGFDLACREKQAEIDALKAQVSKHVESQRLRSIDCAPTDKTVLLLRMGTTMCASGIFDGYTGYWMWPHDAMPTHWQELPEALAKATGEKS